MANWFSFAISLALYFCYFGIQGERITAYKNCLQNLALKRKLPTTLTLTWEMSCSNVSIRAYKIYYEHQDWLACPDKKMDTRNVRQKSGLFVVNNDTNVVVLSPLHPYSEYKVSIKAIIHNRVEISNNSNLINALEVIGYFNTSQFFPNVQPESTSDNVNEDNDTILFTWSPPSSLKCSDFNGKIVGYEHVFKFTDGCNTEKDETRGTSDPIFEFFKDTAIINYTLLVYAENQYGMINTKLPLIISGSSDNIATIKEYYSPQNVLAELNDTALQICWASFCDVGMSYIIRIRIDEEVIVIFPKNIEDLKINDIQFTILYKYCIRLDQRYVSLRSVGNFTQNKLEKILRKEFSSLIVEVAAITAQGITSFWVMKEIPILTTDTLCSINLIGLLISAALLALLVVFFIFCAKKCLSYRVKNIGWNMASLKPTNDITVNEISNGTGQFQETNIDTKYSRLMVPNTSRKKVSIINCPLPPIPKHLPINDKNLKREDSKNSLVSNDNDYLMPRESIQLQTFEMEDDYTKPSFHSLEFCNNGNSEIGKSRNLIPMRSY